MPYTLAEAVAHGAGEERSFLCPVHGDSSPSASVNMSKKVWFCYVCGAKGRLHGDALLAEPDYGEAARKFREKADAIDRRYPEGWLARFTAGPVHQYWIERFGEKVAREFSLGWDPERQAATYPLRDLQGRLLGVVRRLFDDDGPKYLYPKVDISQYMFGYTPDQRRVVLLVEGAMDAIALHTSGYEAWAIFGARFSQRQAQLVRSVDPDLVITAFDNDDAGFKAHCEVNQALRGLRVDRARWPLSWGKDVDEIGSQHRQEIFSRYLKQGLLCVECEVCGSPETHQEKSIPSSRTTSTRSGMRISRMSA